MNKLLTIFLLCFVLHGNAFHKNKIYQEKYGNVVTFVRIPFENYAVTEKIKIIGQLAEQLSNKLAYKDTILIEFHHLGSTPLRPKNLWIVEKNYCKDLVLFNHIDYSNYAPQDSVVTNQRKSHIPNYKGISIRHIGLDVSIEKILRYIEFSILHEEQNSINSYYYTVHWFDPEKIYEGHYIGLSKQQLLTIEKSPLSKVLKKLLQKKTDIINDKGVDFYFKNNNFYFKNSHTKMKSDEFTFIVPGKKGYLFFTTANSFIYLNKRTPKIKLHTLSNVDPEWNYYAFITYPFNFATHNKTKNLFVYKLRIQGSSFLFSEETNDLLTTYH